MSEMTPQMTPEQFWTQNGGGGGAPSYDFAAQGDTASGVVVSQVVRQRTEIGDNTVKLFNKDGSPQMQVEITLQTNLRNWEKVKKIPTVAGPGGVQLQQHPSEDTGLRRIYAWFKLRDAIVEATGGKPVENGGYLQVRWTGVEPNPKGKEPIKTYQARYKEPDPTNGFFGGEQQAQAPAQAPQQAPQQQYAAPPVQQAPAPQYAPQAPAQQYAPPPVQQPVQQYAPVEQAPAQQWAPPQGVPQGYAQNPAVQQAQVPAVQAPVQQAPPQQAAPQQQNWGAPAGGFTEEPPF